MLEPENIKLHVHYTVPNEANSWHVNTGLNQPTVGILHIHTAALINVAHQSRYAKCYTLLDRNIKSERGAPAQLLRVAQSIAPT